MIGDSTVEIAADCLAYEEGTPVNRLFVEWKRIQGSSAQAVQVSLDGVPSNVVQVSEGAVKEETLIYRAALQQVTNRPLIVRAETAPGFDETPGELAAGGEPALYSPTMKQTAMAPGPPCVPRLGPTVVRIVSIGSSLVESESRSWRPVSSASACMTAR
jgi:hypothetical protein